MSTGWGNANQTISSLQSDLAAANQTIASLTTGWNNANQTISSLTNGWADANSTISTLISGWNSANSTIATLETGWSGANSTIASMIATYSAVILSDMVGVNYSSICGGMAMELSRGLDNGDGNGTAADGQLHVDEIDSSTLICSAVGMIKDIDSGSGSSSPYQLTAVGTTLYFEPTTEPTEPNCGRATELPQAR